MVAGCHELRKSITAWLEEDSPRVEEIGVSAASEISERIDDVPLML
jgi:hypothetical protein